MSGMYQGAPRRRWCDTQLENSHVEGLIDGSADPIGPAADNKMSMSRNTDGTLKRNHSPRNSYSNSFKEIAVNEAWNGNDCR
jgi:hypothetical protein